MVKEAQLKSLLDKVKDEKAKIEKQLLDAEFLLSEKQRELEKFRDEEMVANN